MAWQAYLAEFSKEFIRHLRYSKSPNVGVHPDESDCRSSRKMHRLLERQIQKCTATDGSVDYVALMELVSKAYVSADGERRLRDRALDVLQDEIEHVHSRIREEAESSFNAVMDNAGEGIVIVDADGGILNFNKAAARIFGYEPGEILGKNFSGLLLTHGESLNFSDALRRFSCDHQHAIGDMEGVRKDGHWFPIELTFGELKHSSSLRYLATVRDISLQKRVENELKQSEGRFRDLAGSASDWFWEADDKYKLTFVSDRIGGILGVKPAALLGHDYFELGLDDDDAELATQHRYDIAARLPFRDLVFHVGPVAGKDSKIVRISGLPVYDDQGAFTGYRGLGADVTREFEAENRARQAQQRLIDAMESITDGIAVYDHDDRLLFCNSEYKRFYQDAEPLVETGMTFEQILLSGAYNKIVDTSKIGLSDWLIERLRHHREADGKPLINNTSDGRWLQSRTYRTSDGGLVNVRTDITQLKQREEELNALGRRYELILDSADEGIVGLDHQGRITFANRVAGQMLGLSSEAMVGKCFMTLVQPFMTNDGDCLAQESPLARTFAEGTSHKSDDELFWRGDETNFHAEYLAAPIYSGDDLSGVVVVFRDVTLKLSFERALADHQLLLERQVEERTSKLSEEVAERTRTEAALRDSQARLKNIADSLFESILVVADSGTVQFANLSAIKLLSGDGGNIEIEGRHIDGVVKLVKDNAPLSFDQSPLNEMIATSEVQRNDDAVFLTSSGALLSVAYACSPLTYDTGRRSAILSFRDIADLKHAQREALHASRLASVGELAAGIAHEINTPIQYIGDNLRFIGDSINDLTAVVASARQLSDSVRPSQDCYVKAVEFQGIIDKLDVDYLLSEAPSAIRQSLDGVAQVARIVLSMKEFSHPGTGVKTMTDLNRAIENTLVVSRNTWKHVAEMDWKPAADLPMVACLPGEMNQVFLNIIVNAAHAIEGSGKKLPGKISVSTAKLSDDRVEIRISDSGTGVPDAIRDRIFDPFFTTKGVGKGTGQGLAISRDVVVTKHGGKLLLEGKEGEGATFVILLPVNEPESHSEHGA